VLRCAALLLILCGAAPAAWIESVEFRWNDIPQSMWESRLVWLKNSGITHVAVPAGEGRDQVLVLLRKLHLEPVHEPLPSISLGATNAATRARAAFIAGRPGVTWTGAFDTLQPDGYHPGAFTFANGERSPARLLQRLVQLTRFWSAGPAAPASMLGAALRVPAAGIAVHQYTPFVSVANTTAKPWTGDVSVMYTRANRAIAIPAVIVPAHDTLWLPVNLPLAGPQCPACTAFAKPDHLIYATAELSGMEYENGILALEFYAPNDGEAVLQLTQEPTGPYVAGGKPLSFEWDDNAKRARLHIPAGAAPSYHVRVGLAIDAPDATAFFPSARALIIGETNRLVAEFSSPAIATRSRLLISPELAFRQAEEKDPLQRSYAIDVPLATAHGDTAELSIEADGQNLSHTRLPLYVPVRVSFPDRITVRMSADTSIPLDPAVVPVNQRTGRDVTITVRNNAPEIRSFQVELTADGIEFSPASQQVTIAASASRDISFRVFASKTTPGLHDAQVKVTGSAALTQSLCFLVIPPTGEIAWGAGGFTFLEDAKRRASLWPGRWFEFLDKDQGRDALPPGGQSFTVAVESLTFAELEKRLPAH
jgi:hypothetical protein